MEVTEIGAMVFLGQTNDVGEEKKGLSGVWEDDLISPLNSVVVQGLFCKCCKCTSSPHY
jgi:hypothetical protein